MLLKQIKNSSSSLTILEGKKLKDTVHDGDNNGETQQIWVGFQEGHLCKRIVYVICNLTVVKCIKYTFFFDQLTGMYGYRAINLPT